MRILVIDIGGSNIKLRMSGQSDRTKVKSGSGMTPQDFLERVNPIIKDWPYDVISIGIPTAVADGKLLKPPPNLGEGWMDFDFDSAFDKPCKLINDAAMQAYGGYEGGRMLFIGLGTGLGAALIVNNQIIPLELSELRYNKKQTLEDVLSKKNYKSIGATDWLKMVNETLEMLRAAFIPDYILIGGGNSKHLKKMPDYVRIGNNCDAFLGGEKLWGDSQL